ncbi:MAG: hypothetical protein KF860_17660 [Cyclobacteriaceae bacterium]|nr:hypothetical protein [Cyclobacteriaceae bacterium]
MGTSASGGGAGNNNPLIPSWIPFDGGLPPQNDTDNEGMEDGGGEENEGPVTFPIDQPEMLPDSKPESPIVIPANRYTAPRKQLNKFVSSGGTDRKSFDRALRGYSRNAAGSTSGLARRMAPSAARVAGFTQTINLIRSEGLDNTLRRLNLTEYIGKPVVEVLSALTDYIFSDIENIFHDTQDDSLTKQAYANAIVRICETDDIDLNTLTNENIEVMTATFIEETIVQRVFTDIGNDITKKETDIDKLIEIENTAYQIVSGWVRNTIVPEIKAMQLGNQDNLRQNIENIYRIAFDTLSKIQN